MNKSRILIFLGGALLAVAGCADVDRPVNTSTPTGPGVADISAADEVGTVHSVAGKGAATGAPASGGAVAGGGGGHH